MDSQERHELKQNDLYEFITHFKDWWAKQGTNTLLILCAIVAGVVGYRWWSSREFKANEKAYSAYSAAFNAQDLPSALANVALDFPESPVANQARLSAGDALMVRVLFGQREKAEDTPVFPDSNTAKMYLDTAIRNYLDAIQNDPKTTPPSVVVLNARIGLASAYESRAYYHQMDDEADKAKELYDKAREQYRTLISSSGPFKTIARTAELKLDSLKDVESVVTLPLAADVKPMLNEKDKDLLNDALNNPLIPGTTNGENPISPLIPNPGDKPDDSDIQVPLAPKLPIGTDTGTTDTPPSP